MLINKKSKIEKEIAVKLLNKMNIVYPRCVDKNDLLQEILLAIEISRKKYNSSKGDYGKFIYIIARNAVIKKLSYYRDYKTCRNMRKTGYHFKSIDEINQFNFSYNERFFDDLDNEYITKIIDIAKDRIKKVSERHLKIFNMRIYEAKSLKIIADELEINYNRVRGNFKYACDVFKKEFLKNYAL